MSTNEIFPSSQDKIPSSQGTVGKEPRKNLNTQTHLVFQCKNCLKIIGDSICYLAANTKLRSIVLTAQHPNTILGTEVSTSNDPYDLGCTFIVLSCKSCKAKLGRVYKATNSKLDYLRDKYTYNIDNFTTYQLGSYSQSGETIKEGEQILELGDTKPILESISRVKEIICAFHDRISKLENVTNSQELPSTNNNNNLSQLSKSGDNVNTGEGNAVNDSIIILDEEEEEGLVQESDKQTPIELNNKRGNTNSDDNNDYDGEEEDYPNRRNNKLDNKQEEDGDHNETYSGESDFEEISTNNNNNDKAKLLTKSNSNNTPGISLRIKKKIRYTR
ncbi:hypothetical protein CONCODRAFT_2200 [Conidiobolus coronatus NRRL 28638]|uniref:Mis18 domain-containing protein n=1 Tax=Conidiobolus coronatus (strain ATCC 28846 / CBS 209.66 / NRRL 28638) TaxID=796925 RepID=A0A137PI16_CONC2|nr:hypothetical protein CONCODRAFT_2200 [Conidiobolus coronatus NRRL 28638]|eukprot:KXN74643.1 hypothetical protein CONCODRAFT_2200 [Conidiobolus coronatus NRRL 28638]